MKNILLFSLLFIYSKNIISQDIDWYNYDFDSIVSLDMPFDVYEVDTLLYDKKYYQLISENSNRKFTAQKTVIEDFSFQLPKTIKDLNELYIEFSWILEEMTGNKLVKSQATKTDDLYSYKLIFRNENEIDFHELRYVLINKTIYIFHYQNDKGIIESESDFFFNSIRFNKQELLVQYRKSNISKFKYLIIGLLVLFLLSFILRMKKSRN